MRRIYIVIFGIAAAIFLPISAMAGSRTVLEFDTMVGVSGPFLGNANPIRDVPGGGRPWVLDKAKGELESDGELEIKVKGLIIPASEPDFGFNPAPFFKAIVSCITLDESGAPVIENVITQNGDEVMKGDPRNGDAEIEAKLDLPNPCIAPIIFVTSPTGSWFSVTGAESLTKDEKDDEDDEKDHKEDRKHDKKR